MDDLIAEFITETSESLGKLDIDLINLEQNPNDKELLGNIFRLMHTIKGTCGFLGLPRLEKVAHHAENVLGRFRDGDLEVTPAYVTLILESIDRIKNIIEAIEETGSEPEGDDSELIERLDIVYEGREAESGDDAPKELSAQEELDKTVDEARKKLEEEQALFDSIEVDPKPEDTPKEEKKAAAAPTQKETEKEPPAAAKEKSLSVQSLRVNVDVLEDLMTMVSELVLTRNQLLQISRTKGENDFTTPLQRLNHVVSDLQEGVMKTRMQPIGNAWAKLPRIIRDISIDLNKKIDLQMLGQDTELDRQVLDLIKDPLTHMVRNSADHGIEKPEDRLSAGKPEMGKIVLNAYHEGGHIIIEIKDDGKGLSTERIRNKILENGLATEEEVAQMSNQQIHMHIFAAGFSTAEQVTAVSGRGVGMDVVRTNIEKIGGSIDLKSEEGKGSVFKIKIPLTLAIVSALIIESSQERFAIPQLAVRELVMTSLEGEHKIEEIKGAPVMRLRDRLLPLVSLKDLLKLSNPIKDSEVSLAQEQDNLSENSSEDADGTPKGEFLVNGQAERQNQYVVVTQVGGYSFGIMVDRVYDTEEIVVKPVANIIKDIELFSGNTILGDGSVIMILDPNGIAKATGEAVGEADEASAADIAEAHAKEKTSLILFGTGDESPKTVPLALVSRLEMIKTADLEYANDQILIQYRGQLMPIVPFSDKIDLKSKEDCPVLVFTDDDRVMGLAVEEIIDIKEEAISVQVEGNSPGIVGTAILDQKATDVIDVGHYIRRVRSDWFKNHQDGDYQKTTNIFADPQQASHIKRVLLVDDSPFFRNMLTPILSMAGYNVTALDNAKEALDKCEAGETFDLIISDIEMPEMDGYEFVQAVKESENWSDTPVLALSSHTTEKDIERGRKAGFISHLAKFDRDNILQTLNETLSGALKEAS